MKNINIRMIIATLVAMIGGIGVFFGTVEKDVTLSGVNVPAEASLEDTAAVATTDPDWESAEKWKELKTTCEADYLDKLDMRDAKAIFPKGIQKCEIRKDFTFSHDTALGAAAVLLAGAMVAGVVIVLKDDRRRFRAAALLGAALAGVFAGAVAVALFAVPDWRPVWVVFWRGAGLVFGLAVVLWVSHTIREEGGD